MTVPGKLGVLCQLASRPSAWSAPLAGCTCRAAASRPGDAETTALRHEARVTCPARSPWPDGLNRSTTFRRPRNSARKAGGPRPWLSCFLPGPGGGVLSVSGHEN